MVNLVKTVTDSFKISQRFFNVKAKMLKLDKLKYPDLTASVGKTNKKVSFEETVKILNKAFAPVGEKYIKMLNNFVEKGHVDVYPKKGKRGGAYCNLGINLPTMVLLNHTDNIDSVMTFAASWISNMVRSSPPAIEKSTPFAPWIETSRSGELMAIFAASAARLSPLA